MTRATHPFDWLHEGPADDDEAPPLFLFDDLPALLSPARPVRTEDPARARLPAAPPAPFDGVAGDDLAALSRLCGPAPTTGNEARDAGERYAAALHLVRRYELEQCAPLTLGLALRHWWQGARRVVAVSDAFGRPGRPVGACRAPLFRLNGPAFADALDLPNDPHKRAALFEAAGVPWPKPTGRPGFRPGPGVR